MKKGRKAAALPFDISQIKSLDSFVNEFTTTLKINWSTDKFDFLINNAGIGATIMIPQVMEEDF